MMRLGASQPEALKAKSSVLLRDRITTGDQSFMRIHNHFLLATIVHGTCRLGLAYHPYISIPPNTESELLVIVTGADTKPATARASITFTPPTAITVRLLPVDETAT